MTRAAARPAAWVATSTLAVVLATSAYVVARGVHVPITYDEATSVARYVESDLWGLVDFSTATNHLLNSTLTRVSAALFGDAPWALRLPNLLAGVVYLAFGAALVVAGAPRLIAVGGVVLVATNPYLLDFFALSRGYGLGIALLTGAIWALARWWDQPRGSTAAGRTLALVLGLSGAAVVASYALLHAFLAMLALVALRFAKAREPADSAPFPGRAVAATLAVVVGLGAAFSFAVYVHARVHGPDAYVPVVIRAAGLFEEERAAIAVAHVDATGRLRTVPRRRDGSWTLGAVHDAWTHLRISLPRETDLNLARLEVRIGDVVHVRDRENEGPWRVLESGAQRVLVSTAPLTWRPDDAHRTRAARLAATTTAGLTTLALVLVGLGGLAVRRRWVWRREAGALAVAVVAVAAAAAAPVHVLRRNGELFFGGRSGLGTDTFTSLVQGTAYDRPLPDGAERLVAIALATIVASFAAAWVVSPAARSAGRLPGALLAMIAIIAALIELQHQWFGTPYVIARTALYLLPLTLLFAVTAARAVAAVGPGARRAATLAVVAAAAASAWHFARAANVSHARDWHRDAATPAMLARLGQTLSSRPASPAERLGVEWLVYPSVRYYAARGGAGRPLDVVVLPGDGLPVAAIYARPASGLGRGELVQRYPETDTALWRSGT